MFLIASNPRVQRALHEELDTLTTDEVSYVSLETFQRLPYLDAVIKEGMRMMPPVSSIGRELTSELKVGGYTLPVGCNIIFFLYQLFRDPEQFANPNEFFPERFLTDSEENTSRHAFSFIPFSGGLRNCIGQKFALNELKIFLIKILSRFELSTSVKMEDIRYSQGLTLTIANKIDMEFKERE